jgi:hypothetical protein
MHFTQRPQRLIRKGRNSFIALLKNFCFLVILQHSYDCRLMLVCRRGNSSP